jgi:DNA-binding LytR/AlgR family response regulator
VRLELIHTEPNEPALREMVLDEHIAETNQPTRSATQRAFEPGVELPYRVPQSTPPARAISPRAERMGAAKPVRVGIRMNRRILFLDSAEILALEAEGNYVLVRHLKASYMARERISELANRLEDYGFIRIHRSVVVNIAHVNSVEPLSNGDGQVQMRGGSNYAIGRAYKKNLRRIAELWVGM